MKKLLLTTALSVIVFSGIAQPAQAQLDTVSYSELPAGSYELEKTHAQFIWKVMHMGLSNYTARFKTFDADITLDPKNPENSKVVATIDPMSIETDYPNAEEKDFNAKLAKGEGWFNAAAFPEIKFESTSLKKTGEDTGVMTGDLTFLGVTKPVSLNVTFNGALANHPYQNNVPAMGFSAKGSLKRSDWGMTQYLPSVGDEVELQIEAEFVKSSAE